MTREELLELARRTPDVGMAKHVDFVDYLVPVQATRQVNGEWTTTESAYMTVVGKIAMANQDHRAQGKRLNFEDPVVLVDNDEQLTLMVVIDSDIYGRRHGIATSRRMDGSNVEREFPWEVAETSALGRALTSMGYGALAGAGLASAEDMQRATEAETPPASERQISEPAAPTLVRNGATRAAAPQAANRRVSRVSRYQHDKLLELYRDVYGADAETAEVGVDAMFQQAFGHGVDEASYNEGAQVTARLLAQQRQIRNNGAAAAG